VPCDRPSGALPPTGTELAQWKLWVAVLALGDPMALDHADLVIVAPTRADCTQHGAAVAAAALVLAACSLLAASLIHSAGCFI
jgi:hypothetical protein